MESQLPFEVWTPLFKKFMYVFVSGYHLTYSSSDWWTLIITSELHEIYGRKELGTVIKCIKVYLLTLP